MEGVDKVAGRMAEVEMLVGRQLAKTNIRKVTVTVCLPSITHSALVAGHSILPRIALCTPVILGLVVVVV